MASSGNFCVMNPRNWGGMTIAQGGLKVTSTANDRGIYGTMAFPSTGKWYWELYVNDYNNGGHWIGAGNNNFEGDNEAVLDHGFLHGTYNGSVQIEGTTATATGYTDKGAHQSTDGDIYSYALDMDNQKFYVAKNNTYFNSADAGAGTGGLDVSTSFASPESPFYPVISRGNSFNETYTFNFGQDSTFGGAVTAATNTDSNGFGNFKYAVPSGFLALSTANIPVDANIDPAKTDNNIPTKNFNAVIYTGTGTSQGITGVGFQPDLVWIKERGGSGHNKLSDSTRGVQKELEITDTEGGSQPAETTNTDGVTAFGTDGFTAGGDAEYNGSTKTYVAWCWRANGGTTSTNTDGTVASTVQANQAAGFSIVSYTGTGTAMTIGHGLSKAPNFTIVKDRSNANNWIAFYDVEDGSLDYMFPNAYTGKANTSLTGPNSSIWNFSASDTYSNTSSRNYIMYAWHNVEGYQKFDTYEGNNTDDNGPFVYTGFRPRLLVIKGIDEAYGWYVFDSVRDGVNRNSANISWFPGGAETDEPTGARKVDFLSNGFKVMADAASINGANDTYLYMAWGDIPAKYSPGFGFVGTEE